MSKIIYLADQWCTTCEDFVTIRNEVKIQKCPNCGVPLYPCDICDGIMSTPPLKCNECPLEN